MQEKKLAVRFRNELELFICPSNAKWVIENKMKKEIKTKKTIHTGGGGGKKETVKKAKRKGKLYVVSSIIWSFQRYFTCIGFSLKESREKRLRIALPT